MNYADELKFGLQIPVEYIPFELFQSLPGNLPEYYSEAVFTDNVATIVKNLTLQSYSYLEQIEKRVDFLLENSFSRDVKCFGPKSDGSPLYQEILGIFLRLCLIKDIHTVQLINFDLLYSQQITSEDDAIKWIQAFLEEVEQYPSSMVLFDLDSLAEASKHYSSWKDVTEEDGNAAFHYQIQYPRLLSMIFTKIFNCPGENRWMIALSNNSFITQKFKERAEWPKTPKERRKLKEEEEKEKWLDCVYCNRRYQEKDNHEDQCTRHLGGFYKIEEMTKDEKTGIEKPTTIYPQKEFVKFRQKILTGEEHGTSFRWNCCGQSFFSSGEKQGTHCASD